jgi:hypothetical protein
LAHLDPLEPGSNPGEVRSVRIHPFVHNNSHLYVGYVELQFPSGNRDIHPFSPQIPSDLPLPAPTPIDRWNPYRLGPFVVFDSSQELSDLDDANQVSDIYFRDGFQLPPEPAPFANLVSVNHSGNGAGNGPSTALGVSADERFILFHSLASDLVANDTNQLGDLFLRDLRTQTTLLLSAGLGGCAADGSTTRRVMFNRDGTKVIFESHARDLAPGDYNQTRDVFVATLSLPDSDGDGLPDSCELTWFGTLAKDGGEDSDGDGALDRDEHAAGTSPIKGLSVFGVITIQQAQLGLKSIIWTAAPGRRYQIEYRDALRSSGWIQAPEIISATSSTADWTDLSSPENPQRFYRVRLLP